MYDFGMIKVPTNFYASSASGPAPTPADDGAPDSERESERVRKPRTRLSKWLAKIAGVYDDPMEPKTDAEYYLNEIAKGVGEQTYFGRAIGLDVDGEMSYQSDNIVCKKVPVLEDHLHLEFRPNPPRYTATGTWKGFDPNKIPKDRRLHLLVEGDPRNDSVWLDKDEDRGLYKITGEKDASMGQSYAWNLYEDGTYNMSFVGVKPEEINDPYIEDINISVYYDEPTMTPPDKNTLWTGLTSFSEGHYQSQPVKRVEEELFSEVTIKGGNGYMTPGSYKGFNVNKFYYTGLSVAKGFYTSRDVIHPPKIRVTINGVENPELIEIALDGRVFHTGSYFNVKTQEESLANIGITHAYFDVELSNTQKIRFFDDGIEFTYTSQGVPTVSDITISAKIVYDEFAPGFII